MGQAYRIVDWSARYEVNSGGKPATAETVFAKLKKKALEYVRWLVYGHKLGAGYRMMMETAGKLGPGMDLAVFGLFGKLLELAADQPAELRGWILDNQGEPIDAAQIQYIIFSNDLDVVKRGLEVLAAPAVGWLEIAEFSPDSAKDRDCPPVLAESGGTPPKPAGVDLTDEEGGGERATLLDETETETKTETKTETEAAEGPPISDSDLPQFSRVSVSGQCEGIKLVVADMLGINCSNRSDLTTLQDIFAQVRDAICEGGLEIAVLEKIKDKARMCKGKPHAIATFVKAAKEQFGYVPVARRILEKPPQKKERP